MLRQVYYHLKDLKVTGVDWLRVGFTDVSVTIDASTVLLKNGNQYRASEAEQLAKRAAREIAQVTGIQEGPNGKRPISLYVTITIVFEGTNQEVASASLNGNFK